MTSPTREPRGDRCLPSSVPALQKLFRVPEAGSDTRQYVGLDRNERLVPFPDWFIEDIRQSATSTLLTWYPTQDQLHGQLCDEL